METKEDLLKKIWEARWEIAVDMAGKLDTHVNLCFKEIVDLENKGLIDLNQHSSSKYTEVFNAPFPDIDLEQVLNKRFADIVMFIFDNQPDFIKEYDRLNNTNISSKLSPIENMIDEVSGNRDKELKDFFSFVKTTVFEPIIEKELEPLVSALEEILMEESQKTNKIDLNKP